MSEIIVDSVKISEVKPHHNADKLDIVKCYGFEVVTQRGKYKVGDRVIYLPPDSVITPELEAILFPPDSKIFLNNRRIRAIKIRGQISYGMIVDSSKVNIDYVIANVSKYEPPAASIPAHMGVKTSKKISNPNFTKYTDIENFKYYDRVFQDGEPVYVSEKLHGTSFRCGWFKNEPTTLWKKALNFLGLLQPYEFCWGSRTVQIQGKVLGHKGYYDEDVYTKMVNQYNLKSVIPKGFGVYGEIVGDGIQKNYTYGCKQGEHKLYVYDISIETPDHPFAKNRWLNFEEFDNMIVQMGLTPVPNLYVGPFDASVINLLRDGDSTVGGQPVREGVVIKSLVEEFAACGRKALKYISDAYYLQKDGTDFH